MITTNEYNSAAFALHIARSEVEAFIKDLREDLEALKEERFQRHIPEYYDEVNYYNWFHEHIPQSLLCLPGYQVPDCYKAFSQVYHIEHKNLFEAISAFLEAYDKEISNYGLV